MILRCRCRCRWSRSRSKVDLVWLALCRASPLVWLPNTSWIPGHEEICSLRCRERVAVTSLDTDFLSLIKLKHVSYRVHRYQAHLAQSLLPLGSARLGPRGPVDWSCPALLRRHTPYRRHAIASTWYSPSQPSWQPGEGADGKPSRATLFVVAIRATRMSRLNIWTLYFKYLFRGRQKLIAGCFALLYQVG